MNFSKTCWTNILCEFIRTTIEICDWSCSQQYLSFSNKTHRYSRSSGVVEVIHWGTSTVLQTCWQNRSTKVGVLFGLCAVIFQASNARICHFLLYFAWISSFFHHSIHTVGHFSPNRVIRSMFNRFYSDVRVSPSVLLSCLHIEVRYFPIISK
jgi:hypothetical protein